MKNKVSIRKDDYLNIVGDGAIASTKTADGRLIPVVILDTTVKKDLEHLVHMHGQSETGDVTSIWAIKRFNHDFVSLVLYFKNPMELKIAISFNTLKNSALVEGILTSRAIYIQPGIRHNINAPKILVEIPARTTFDKWNDIFEKAVRKKLKKEGISNKALNNAAQEHISIIKDIWGKRLK